METFPFTSTIFFEDDTFLVDTVLAEYRIYAEWSFRKQDGTREILEGYALLVSWGHKPFDRVSAVQLFGEPAVILQENEAFSQWELNAVEDDADAYADQVRSDRA